MLAQTTYSGASEIRDVLALSIFDPTADKLAVLCAHYDSDPSMTLFSYQLDGRLIGCVGVQVVEPAWVTIRHIAVVPSERGRGVARRMLDQLISDHRLRRLEAETDRDAVGFYRRYGFDIASLGEVYPGVERFSCALNVAATRE